MAVHKLGYCYFVCYNVFCYFAKHVIVKDTQAIVNSLNKTIVARSTKGREDQVDLKQHGGG